MVLYHIFVIPQIVHGSNVYAKLNGATIKTGASPIVVISDTINVKAGDVLELYAYGNKGSTSNASAVINAVFSTYT